MANGEIERRVSRIPADVCDCGCGGDDCGDTHAPYVIMGYAIPFGKLSRPMTVGGRRVFERVHRDAFRAQENSGWPDVECRYGDGRLLGRSRNKSLYLGIDDYGLIYGVGGYPDEDITEAARSGDIRHCAVNFRVHEDELDEPEPGAPVRTVLSATLVSVYLLHNRAPLYVRRHAWAD